jgi:hypothetical protein
MVDQPLPRRQLMVLIRRFLKDKNRGISIALFADLCGVSLSTMRDVFLYHTEPLSEFVQRRVWKGYQSWAKGEVAVMQNQDNTKFTEYRRQPKPMLKRSMGLKVVNGEIKVRIGLVHRADYSQPQLDEQLERGTK